MIGKVIRGKRKHFEANIQGKEYTFYKISANGSQNLKQSLIV